MGKEYSAKCAYYEVRNQPSLEKWSFAKYPLIPNKCIVFYNNLYYLPKNGFTM